MSAKNVKRFLSAEEYRLFHLFRASKQLWNQMWANYLLLVQAISSVAPWNSSGTHIP